jgi:hypothetical protein
MLSLVPVAERTQLGVCNGSYRSKCCPALHACVHAVPLRSQSIHAVSTRSLQLTSCPLVPGPAGTPGFCEDQCCAGVCSHDVANQMYFCCEPLRNLLIKTLKTAHMCTCQSMCRQGCPSLNHVQVLLCTALSRKRVVCMGVRAGPLGTAGHCSGECCSAATNVCIVKRQASGEACCAPRCSPFFAAAGKLLVEARLKLDVEASCWRSEWT